MRRLSFLIQQMSRQARYIPQHSRSSDQQQARVTQASIHRSHSQHGTILMTDANIRIVLGVGDWQQDEEEQQVKWLTRS